MAKWLARLSTVSTYSLERRHPVIMAPYEKPDGTVPTGEFSFGFILLCVFFGTSALVMILSPCIICRYLRASQVPMVYSNAALYRVETAVRIFL